MTDDVVATLRPYVDFEQSQWTNGSVDDDPFYQAPAYDPADKPGKVLKLEEVTDTTEYLLPAGISMSRFIYLSQTVGGFPVPVSAYMLWPFAPRAHRESGPGSTGFPVVAWAHGTSGINGDAAPSHYRNLWQHFMAPYPLVLNGFVVVATDYAGLGIRKDAEGTPIDHPYLCSASHAIDVVYSVQAVQDTFPILSRDFIVVRHSQGGGAAWAVAERQALHSSGCIGCISISPVIRFLDEGEPFGKILTAAVGSGIKTAIPNANLDSFLTPAARERLSLVHETKAGVLSGTSMLLGVDLLKSGFKDDQHLREYAELCAVGEKAVGCPLLIIHGQTDLKASPTASHRSATRTAELFPHASITYVGLPSVTHDSAMTTSQSIWMEWIAARFDGEPASPRFMDMTIEPMRPAASYHPEQNWYMAPAIELYQNPLR